MRTATLVLAAVLSLAACGPKDAAVEPGAGSGKPLNVGMEIAYPPFEFMDAKTNQPSGFDVELVKALGAHLGRPVNFVNLGWDALIPELQSGRIDVVCSGMSYTDERAKTVDFSRSYAGSPMWILANSELVKEGTAVADLDRPDVQVAMQRATTGEMKARATFPKASPLVFDTQAEAGNTVATGRAHVFVYDKVTIEKLHEEHRTTTRILPGDLGQERYCMAVAKGSPLRAQIDEFLDEATAPGGKVDELLKKWVPGWEQYRPRER